MKLKEFDYKLPNELIAQFPLEKRDSSKLMIIDRSNESIMDKHFYNLDWELWENDVLVVNKTRVINARLKWYIYKSWYWNVEKKRVECEIFLHKQISNNTWDCLVYPWKKLKPWNIVIFWDEYTNFWFSEWWLSEPDLILKSTKLNNSNVLMTATIKSISESWRILEFSIWWVEFLDIIDKLGQTPLPPYIKEKLEEKERYQTVFNKVSWSVAAPTAWLHFTKELIKKLKSKWVIFEEVLLNVWIWTFVWVKTENIKEHKMHSELIELEKEVSIRLNKYKKSWKRIIAVWTTSVRVLESFSKDDWLLEFWKKETDIFIYPSYKWKFVDSIITNFHLPKSSLLMLVSSFAWTELIKKAYSRAIGKKYRFFSFGDAMWIK